MKDFLPTFTFGFLMAQLFPGGVAVLCATFPYVTLTSDKVVRLTGLFNKVGDVWFGSARNTVVFLFAATATGMFIHGLDWVCLGWQTHAVDERNRPKFDENQESVDRPLRHHPFHRKNLAVQFVTAPWEMVAELLSLTRVPKLSCVAMGENVPRMQPTHMPIFSWLQDFYLYFAQFYLHMAYALLVGIPAVILSFIFWGEVSLFRILFVISLSSMMSFFFLLGRIQLLSLFKNEMTLTNNSQKSEPIKNEVTLTTNSQEGEPINLGIQPDVRRVYFFMSGRKRVGIKPPVVRTYSFRRRP